MDIQKILERAGAALSDLDSKKEQTSKKIEYVTRYVEEWIRVGCMSDKIQTLSFIDCMSNAGIYKDGELGTATKVYEMFINAAREHPSVNFNLIFNDIGRVRIEIFKSVCDELREECAGDENLSNLKAYFSNNDVNEFIVQLPRFDKQLSRFGCLSLIFVDPYDARTVKANILREYINKRYCELFFNWFSSDHVRNPDDASIKKCFTGIDIPHGYDATKFIAEYFVGDTPKAYFCYAFRNINNTELYQIIFITPHIKGLEKVKDALWDTFSGREYHRNTKQEGQMSMFDLDEGKVFLKNSYGEKAQAIIMEELNAGEYAYKDIETVVLQRSMLRSSDVIQYVIKPMIRSGCLIKNNRTRNRNNYTKDSYSLVKAISHDAM